jgi:deazaflavin-dependent oxidoreductase (nitroreductase family)
MSKASQPIEAVTPVDDRTAGALSRGHLIDMTTTGRRTGLPRRVEIVFHNIDGRIYISGIPSRRKRSWIANLEADPALTFHLKGPVRADLAARARVITDEAERWAIMPAIARNWRRSDVETMVAWSPLIEVEIEGYTPAPIT